MSNWSELHDAGYAAAEEGNLKKSSDFLRKAVKEAEAKETIDELCQSINCLAVVYQALGKDSDAKKMFERTIELKPETIELPAAIEALADLYAEEDDDKALELYHESIREYVRLGEHDALLDAQNKIMTILLFDGESALLKERKLSKAESENFKRQAAFGSELIGLGLEKNSSMTPAQVVQQIDAYVDAWQDEEIDADELDAMDVAKGLGALWAQELVNAFKWSWICLEGAGNLYVVASEDRALVINPTFFVKSCLDMPELDCTIMLAFNMLQEGQFEEIPAGSFENVMEGVHRIVPKPGRSLSMAAGRLPE